MLKRRVRGELSDLADRHHLDLVQHIPLTEETAMNAESFWLGGQAGKRIKTDPKEYETQMLTQGIRC